MYRKLRDCMTLEAETVSAADKFRIDCTCARWTCWRYQIYVAAGTRRLTDDDGGCDESEHCTRVGLADTIHSERFGKNGETGMTALTTHLRRKNRRRGRAASESICLTQLHKEVTIHNSRVKTFAALSITDVNVESIDRQVSSCIRKNLACLRSFFLSKNETKIFREMSKRI